MLDRRTSRSSPTSRRVRGASARLAGEEIDERNSPCPAGPGGTGRVRLDGAARARPRPPAVARPGRRRHGRAGCPPRLRAPTDRPASTGSPGRLRDRDRLLGRESAAATRSLCLRPDEDGQNPTRAIGLAGRQAEDRQGRHRDGLAGDPSAGDARPVRGVPQGHGPRP